MLDQFRRATLIGLCSLNVFAQGSIAEKELAEIIPLGWTSSEVKPGIASVLISEHGKYSIQRRPLKVKFKRKATEDDEDGYLVSCLLPKSCKPMLAWRGVSQIKSARNITTIQFPAMPEQGAAGTAVLKIHGQTIDFRIDRISSEKMKVTARSGSTEQVIFDSSSSHSGYWWVVWSGDLDGDGNLDLIAEHEGFGEYIQARVVSVWLSSLARKGEVLGLAGSRTLFVSGD